MVLVLHLLRRRLRAAAARNVLVTAPPVDVTRERDVPVTMRDGTTLRADVYRPPEPGRYPVLMCAHPYGKDRLPKPRRRGGYRPVLQARIFRHPEPVRVSAWTGWEAPDPAHWVPRGYVVVNADLRGFGHSAGTGELFSDQEGEDYHDLIEWAGTQAWSNGKVGLDGVSYLAISQYRAAAARPPHLAAICPWEGFTDFYRDFARPGGVREDGFLPIWTTGLRLTGGRVATNARREQVARPLMDEWWEARRPALERIEVPALICASFSDHDLHSRGSFEAFRRIGSQHKWLYTHRGGKWSTYYSDASYAVREKFFGWALKDADTGQQQVPPVRLEVRDTRGDISDVSSQAQFPPASVTWQSLHLDAGSGRLAGSAPDLHGQVQFGSHEGAVVFDWPVTDPVDVVGPMWLRLHVEIRGGEDAHVYAAVRKIRNGCEVTFEGSYGYEYDVVTHGMLVASFREADPELSVQPGMPVHSFREQRPFRPGEVAPIDIALLPSATRFVPGDVLRLEIRGRWLFPRDPIRGQFPAWYQSAPSVDIVLHTGSSTGDALLRVPIA